MMRVAIRLPIIVIIVCGCFICCVKCIAGNNINNNNNNNGEINYPLIDDHVANNNDDHTTNHLNTIINKNSDINYSLRQSSILYGLLSELIIIINSEQKDHHQNLIISEKCQEDIKNVFYSINDRNLWAIKALDASGSSRNSFIWGQNAWIGSKVECDFLNTSPHISLTPEIFKNMAKNLISTTAPIQMEYKIIFANFTSSYKIDSFIHLKPLHRLGVCGPAVCTNNEIQIIAQQFFAQKQMNFQRLFDVDVNVTLVRNLDWSNFIFQADTIPIIAGLLCVIILVLLFNLLPNLCKKFNLIWLEEFCECFSIKESVSNIYNFEDAKPSSINAINGIRAIVCIWVMVVHVGFYSMFAYDNLPVVIQTLEQFFVQPIFAGFFYVDVFFVLSSILLVYNFLKNDTKLMTIRNATLWTNFKSFIKTIVHRYIRLTPALLFIMAISQLLSIYLKESSTYYITDNFDLFCTGKSFWRNVFYVQNLFNVYELCLSWSWYLACDMQFYILILFLIYIYAKHPNIAKSLFGIICCGICVITFLSCLINNVSLRIDSMFEHLGVFYTPPWMRMQPYLAGVIIGFIMANMNKESKLNINNYLIRFYWITIGQIIIISLFAGYFKNISNILFAITFSVGRFGLSLSWGSVILMCHLGYGGQLNRFLSSKLLAHFNKLSYMMFLINPFVVTILNSGPETSVHFDMPSIISSIFGVILITYLMAVVCSPIFEIPFQRLSDRYVLGRNNNQKK